MYVVLGIIALVLISPLVLMVAIALGPVTIGVLAMVGFGFAVFAIVNAFIGAGVLGRSAARHIRH
jgi:hypothetical protein